MAENSAEKRESFERWVASLKGNEARGSDPGSSPGSSPGSNERPVTPEPAMAPFDERATTVHRIPKDMIQKLRAREASRSVPPESEPTSSPETARPSAPGSERSLSRPDIARSLAQLDTESTAVFVPPPELLLRAKRMNAPPKPKNAPDAGPEFPQPDYSAPAPNLEPPSLDSFLRSLPAVEESGTRPVSGAAERAEAESSFSESEPPTEALPNPDSRAAWDSVAAPAFQPSKTRVAAWGALMAVVAIGMAVLAYWKLHGFQ